MDDLLSGLVVAVSSTPVGTQTVGTALSGATTLVLEDTVDLNSTGGRVTIDGVLATYVACDDDASTVTLASALAGDVADGAEVLVYPPRFETTALVLTQESSSPIPATVPWHMTDALPPGVREEEDREQVRLTRDGEWSWAVYDLVQQLAGRVLFEADDVYALTAADITAGTATIPLTHQPIDESIKLWWRTVAQEPTEWTADYEGQTITLPLGSFAAAGDRVWVHYAYRAGLLRETSPVPFTVVGNNMGHGFNWTSIGWPVGTLSTDIFVFAQLARTAATNTCTDSRATLVASGATGLDTAKIWTGTVGNTATPLAAAATDLGGVQEDVYGLLVLRPERPISVDSTRIGDSGSQAAGAGSIPALAGSGSGAVGVGFSSAGIGATSPHDWPGTWPGYVDNGNYGRVSFVTNSSPAIGSVPTLSSVDGWRGFTLGLTEG